MSEGMGEKTIVSQGVRDNIDEESKLDLPLFLIDLLGK